MKNENTVNLLNMRNFVIWDLSAPFALKKTSVADPLFPFPFHQKKILSEVFQPTNVSTIGEQKLQIPQFYYF
jgi:hypothetical protein